MTTRIARRGDLRSEALGGGGGPVRQLVPQLIYDDDGDGVALHTMQGWRTAATPERTALSTAMMSIAWQAYRAAGERMPEDVAEVREDTLVDLDALWRAAPCFAPELWPRAAAALRNGSAGLAALEAVLSGAARLPRPGEP